MLQDFTKEHAIETFKSLIQISVEGMKLLALLNGGAAVALLSYLGTFPRNGELIPDMRYPMGWFLFGLVCCGLAFIASYVTQLRLYNESVRPTDNNKYTTHPYWLNLAMFLCILSIGAFAVGSFLAVIRFR
jgi:hypothetical protein